MKVYIATDHSGFELKNYLVEQLQNSGHEVEDCGAHELDPNDDYPDFIGKAAEKVSHDPQNSRGIVIGGSGQGEAMAANKLKGVRCALFYSPAVAQGAIDVSGAESTDPYEIIKLTRIHNNANMLSLSARFLTQEQALKAVHTFLETTFDGAERHQRRIDKISALER